MIGQCKITKARVGPKYVRELEGTVSHENAPGLLGLLVSRQGFTAAAIEQFRASTYPLILATVVPPPPAATVSEGRRRSTKDSVTVTKIAPLSPPRLFTPFAQQLSMRVTVKSNMKTYNVLATGEVVEAPVVNQKVLALIQARRLESRAAKEQEEPKPKRKTKKVSNPQQSKDQEDAEAPEAWPVQGFLVNEVAQKLWPKLQIGSRKVKGYFTGNEISTTEMTSSPSIPIAFYDGQQISQALAHK